jgi:thiol-disulfide isomerase/thioredoxin
MPTLPALLALRLSRSNGFRDGICRTALSFRQFYFLESCFAVLLILSPAIAPGADARPAILAAHLKDLVVLRQDHLVPIISGQLRNAPYLVLYFGAGWCPDCRRFSPALVEAYDRQDKKDAQFEVLFMTKDKSQPDMLKFMRSEKMKWPALDFNKVTAAPDLTQYYSGHGIPCLSVLDRNGKLVLQSKSDQDAAEVLGQLQRLTKPASEPATRRAQSGNQGN